MSSDSDEEVVEPGFGLSDFHRSTRMPLDAVVRLHFEGTVAYQNGFAANVSATGMYVKHPDPPELGTRLVFELTVGEERKPVQGAGVVAWLRDKYDGPGRPAGVGIQFTEIDSLSRQHLAEELFTFLESQLGDEVSEHPDIDELVATTRMQSPLDLVHEPEVAAAETKASPAETPAATPSAPPGGASQPFRLFDNDDSSAAFSETDPNESLFAPAIPPQEVPSVYRAAAGRREKRNPLPAIAIAVGVSLVGFAAWWFLLGPGSLRDEPETAAPATAWSPPPPEVPPLSPTPGADSSLAEAVGAEESVAPEPLPSESLEVLGAAPPPIQLGAQPDVVVGESRSELIVVPATETAPATISASPPATATTAPAVGKRADRLLSIDWEESGDLTVVVLTGNGDFPTGSFRWNEIRDDNPRVLLRLYQVAEGYGKTVMAAGTPELAQVRTGFHEKPTGNELHVVLDLAGSAVRLEGVEAQGRQLMIRLRR